ncbi:hypothetical protein M3Y97_00000400 [Aphelenchoides bicaudatus]|nr:hypothetical protein M3Y97_00000400 [Aphelenchoides bicaudatus]
MQTKKRLDIQGLRAVAIIGVLLFHVWPNWMPNGFYGVDMFFALSGYLMAVLLNKPEKITRNVAADFYFRRFKRILPVYLFIIALTLLSSIFILCRFDYMQPALYFWTNMAVLFTDDNYFTQLFSTKMFLHTWSLAVEIQFYLCVPFVFVLLKLSKQPSFKLMLTALFSTSSYILYYHVPDTWAFEFLPCRIWQFMGGILAFYFGCAFPLKSRFIYLIAIGCAIIVLSIGIAFLIHECVEKPLLKISNLRDLLKTVVCLYTIVFLLYAVILHQKEPDFIKPSPLHEKIMNNLAGNNRTQKVAIDMLTVDLKSQLNRVLTSIPCPNKTRTYHRILNLRSKRIKWECSIKGDGHLDVLIVGNSHAHSSALAWQLALKGQYKRIYWFMTSGCLVFNDFSLNECSQFGKMTLRVIREFQPDILIAMHRYPDSSPLRRAPDVFNDRLLRNMQTFLDTVQPLVKKLILLDRPMLEFPHKNGPLEMAKRLLYGMDIKSMGISRKYYKSRYKDHNGRLKNIICSKCHLIDYLPFFCRKNWCPTI